MQITAAVANLQRLIRPVRRNLAAHSSVVAWNQPWQAALKTQRTGAFLLDKANTISLNH
jgi:hypothetical protein